MSRSILLVEDDPQLGDLISDTLKSSGYKVEQADNGRTACSMIGINGYDAVISDVRIPGMTGIQLLHWVKSRGTATPVILMTAFLDITTEEEAVEFGAAGFLHKPFEKAALLNALEKLLPKPLPEPVLAPVEVESEYYRISIEDFLFGATARQDLYLQLGANKYVKITHAGEELSKDSIERYRAKGIQHLHMRKEDFNAYLDQNVLIVKSARDLRVDSPKRANLLKHTAELFVQKLFQEEMNEEVYSQATDLVKVVGESLSSDNDLLNLLESLRTHSDSLYAHSVGVSVYAGMIARSMGWRSLSTQIRVCMGGMLHDIGKKEIPEEVLLRPRHRQSAEDVRLLESHCSRGAEILSSMRKVPDDIIQIVHQHHENISGTGYPGHLKKSALHPLARVVSMADLLAHLMLGDAGQSPVTPSQAAMRVLQHHQAYYEPAMLIAMMRAFGVADEVIRGFQQQQEHQKKRA